MTDYWKNIKVKNTSKSQDILSALENKYYHASKVSEKIYIDLQNAVANELLEYIFLIRNQLDRDEGTILKNYLFRFRDYFLDSYLPIEEAKANKLYEETKDVIANFIGRFKEARNFYDFLTKKRIKKKYLRLIMRGNY